MICTFDLNLKTKIMIYKTKPSIIRAVQWKDGKLTEAPDWISEALEKPPSENGAIFRWMDDIHIQTLIGIRVAEDGDFIVRGPKGEIYPCKPNQFKETYTEVLKRPLDPVEKAD
jgi:hypothetical protein